MAPAFACAIFLYLQVRLFLMYHGQKNENPSKPVRYFDSGYPEKHQKHVPARLSA